MNMRESFNEQDTSATPEAMAVQVRPSRSIVKALQVRPVPPKVVTDVIEREHYLHSMPVAARACFGVYQNQDLCGAVVFTAGARLGHRLLTACRPQEVATLARLWLSDSCPKNSESRVLGIVLRHVRRECDWKLLLSYADPAAGHAGTIYQAAGWLYLGQTPPSSYLDLGDGRLQHPRSIYERFGSNAVRHLRNTGIQAMRRTMPGKHRYAYILDPSWRWRLTSRPQLYPTRALAVCGAMGEVGTTP